MKYVSSFKFQLRLLWLVRISWAPPVRSRILCSRRSRPWTAFIRRNSDGRLCFMIIIHKLSFTDSSKIWTHRCLWWSMGEIQSRNSATQPRFSYRNDIQIFFTSTTWTRIQYGLVKRNQIKLIIFIDNVGMSKYEATEWEQSVQIPRACSLFFILVFIDVGLNLTEMEK